MNIDSIESAIENIDFSTWDMEAQMQIGLSPADFALKLIKGDIRISDIFEAVGGMLFSSAADVIPVFVMLTALSALCSLSGSVKGMKGEGAYKAAQISFLIVSAVPVCSLMLDALALSADAAARACSLCLDAMPLLCAMLIAIGAELSAGVSSPMVLLCTGASGFFSANILPSLICVMCALALISCMSDENYADGLFFAVNSFSVFALTGTLSLFSASAAVSMGGAASGDSVAMRAAKYAVDNYVPIVGGVFADSFEILRACIGGLKNAVGITACVYLAVICLSPLIDCLAGAVMLKAASALSAMMGAKLLSGYFDKMNRTFILLFACQLGCLLALLVCVCASLRVGAYI